VIRKAVTETVNGLVYPGGALTAHAKQPKVAVNVDTEITDATSGTGTPPKYDVENQAEQVIASTNGDSNENEFALPVDPCVKLSSVDKCIETVWITVQDSEALVAVQDSEALGDGDEANVAHTICGTATLPENEAEQNQTLVRFSDTLADNNNNNMRDGYSDTSVPRNTSLRRHYHHQ
jgi:hypothetical protein